MKRFATAALATLTLMGGMATSAAAYADPPGYNNNDHRNDRHDNNNGRHDDNNGRHDDNDHRWDGNQHNGYYTGSTWHYGPPPAAIQRRADFRPGVHQWRRGERLPSYYRTHYSQVDYRSAHLRAPPRGYHYVRDERGQYLLVGIATGAILSIILNNH